MVAIGANFVKVGRKGSAKVTRLWLSEDWKYLHWDSDSWKFKKQCYGILGCVVSYGNTLSQSI